MSLFGFVKDIGRRVFNKDEEAADKIREHIRDAGIGIRDFDVVFDMGHVILKGEVDSKADKEKAVLLAGNIAGVGEVVANDLTIKAGEVEVAAEAAGSAAPVDVAGGEAADETEFYVIQAGDTLGKIAKRVYGDAMQYPKIFEANREVIDDPDKIFVGQKIRLPK
jgi:nucleoid-associated protein YgaU